MPNAVETRTARRLATLATLPAIRPSSAFSIKRKAKRPRSGGLTRNRARMARGHLNTRLDELLPWNFQLPLTKMA